MKKVRNFTLRAVGLLLMVAAFYQWITFDYPSWWVPFVPGGILSDLPGVLRQFVNWILVCILGSAGILLFAAGRTSEKLPATKDSQSEHTNDETDNQRKAAK